MNEWSHFEKLFFFFFFSFLDFFASPCLRVKLLLKKIPHFCFASVFSVSPWFMFFIFRGNNTLPLLRSISLTRV